MKLHNMSNQFDFMTEDDPVPNQNFVCLSFLEAGETQLDEYISTVHKNTKIPRATVKKCINEYIRIEHPRRGVKIRGSYRDEERTRKRCESMRNLEEEVNVFVGEVGKWLPFNPSQEEMPHDVEENYKDDALDDMIKKYKTGRMFAKDHFNDRKREMMKKAAFEGSEVGQKLMVERDEPLEVVQFNIDSAKEAKKEFEERIAEADRNIVINTEKLKQIKKKIRRGQAVPAMGDDTSLVPPKNFTIGSNMDTDMDLDLLRDIENTRNPISAFNGDDESTNTPSEENPQDRPSFETDSISADTS